MHDRAQLLASLLVGSVALIPDNTLRYISVGLSASLAVIHALYLKRPVTQLRRLEAVIESTDEMIRCAKALCPREHLMLSEQGMRLLEVRRAASMITCRILETRRFTLRKYALLSRDIAECTRDAESIRTAVQLTLEAERQRRFAQDINETEGMLATIRGYGAFWMGINSRGPRALGWNYSGTAREEDVHAYSA